MATDKQHILATGGLGYIGSHTVVDLLNHGFRVTVIDNLDNSSLEVLNRIQELTSESLNFYKGDVRDKDFLDSVFKSHLFDAVIHFAGLKAVGESCENPLLYYDVNVVGSIRLIEAMKKYRVNKIVFSSSATVYGEPQELPISENAAIKPASPYGDTKRIVEKLLQSLSLAKAELNVAILRYFNPVGAHQSGHIGENPKGIPNNLVPYITQVAVGKHDFLRVFGNDYDTHDGTGVRDYIHICDLSKAHLKAIEYLNFGRGYNIWNIGVGQGYSVLDVVRTFERINDVKVPYKILPRRSGDIDTCFADPNKAQVELGWSAKFGLEEMVRDSWNWQIKNPKGYEQ
jgi:UDP-glucose 4-epimerase